MVGQDINIINTCHYNQNFTKRTLKNYWHINQINKTIHIFMLYMAILKLIYKKILFNNSHFSKIKNRQIYIPRKVTYIDKQSAKELLSLMQIIQHITNRNT